MTLIVGVGGMIFILIAFILDEFVPGFDQNTWRYNLLNIMGSGLLIYYAFSLESWPFIILNAVWLIVAVVKSVEILNSKKR